MKKQGGKPQSTFASTSSALSSLPKPDFSHSSSKNSSGTASPERLSPSSISSSKPIDLVASLGQRYGKPSELREALRKALEKFHLTLNEKSDTIITSWKISSSKKEGLKALRTAQLKTIHESLKNGKISVVDFDHHKITLHDDEGVRIAITQVLAEEAKSEFGSTPEWGGEYNSLILTLRELIKEKKFVILRYKSAADIYKAQIDSLRKVKSVDLDDTVDSDFDFQFELSSSEESPQKRKLNSAESSELRRLQEENETISRRLDHTTQIFSLDISSKSGAEIEFQQRIDELQRMHQDELQKKERLSKSLSVKELEIQELRAASKQLSKRVEQLESKVAASESPENYDDVTQKQEEKHQAELKAQAEKFEHMLAERDRVAREREAQLRAELKHLSSQKSDSPPRESSELQKGFDKLLKEKVQLETQNRFLNEEVQLLGSLTDDALKAQVIEGKKALLCAEETIELLRNQVKALQFGGVPEEYAVAAQSVSRARKNLFGSEQDSKPKPQPMFIEGLNKMADKRRPTNKAMTPPNDDSDGSLSL